MVGVSLPVVAGAFWGIAIGLMLVLASVPFGVFVALHLDREHGLPVLPGLVVSAGFGVFFGAGVMAWAINGREMTIGYVVSPTGALAVQIMFWLAAMTTAFIVGERIVNESRPISSLSGKTSALYPVSQVLFGLALVGTVLTVQRVGGWRHAVTLLTSHNKQTLLPLSGTLGRSLWSVFCVPAIVALGLSALESTRTKRLRIVAALEVGLMAYVCVTLFGSRLLLTLGAIGIVAGRYAAGGRRIRPRTLGLAIVALLLLSSIVLSQRSPSSNGNTGTIGRQLQTLGYGIFEVSTASWIERDTLAGEFRDTTRAGRILASAIPAIGPRGGSFNAERLDVITVRAVGRASEANTTGLPPSFPTFALIAFGPVLSCLIGLLAGMVMASGSAVFLRQGTAMASLFYGLWCAFLFNDFKGGDVLLDFTAEFRKWLYLSVIIGGVSLLSSWRFQTR